jgi:peptidoglycan/xylan/chitin deacetylase (PgdA/CDA1 family)
VGYINGEANSTKKGMVKMKKAFLIPLFILFITFPTIAVGEQKIPILVYHSIDEFHGHGSKELYVTPENFEKQMIFLKDNGYTLLTFDRWNDLKKVPKPIFITIDDGYKNNENVFIIFQKLKNKQFQPTATLFIISDFIGNPGRLSKSDLKMMAQSGYFSIQSHTATHPDLTKTSNIDYELKESKQKIQQITGKPVMAISYPFGTFNDQMIKEVKKYYLFGLTTTPGSFSKKGIENENYLLPRSYIKNSTTIENFENIIEK